MANKTPPANDNVDPRLALLSVLDALTALDIQIDRAQQLLEQMEVAADKQRAIMSRVVDRAKALTDSLKVTGP